MTQFQCKQLYSQWQFGEECNMLEFPAVSRQFHPISDFITYFHEICGNLLEAAVCIHNIKDKEKVPLLSLF